MKIATLLFTYNRSWHTEQVLKALSQNNTMPEKLYVFQDGLKCTDDIEEWNKVNNLLKGIDWCDKEIIEAETNKGLAASIVSGIDYAFEKYDAVIVLEDDCVPAIDFLKFMNQCFTKYQDDKSVYSVSGYSYPVTLTKDRYDIYGCGRISSWGWGTWKDRWGLFKKDYELVKKMKQEEETSRYLGIWGSDLESMLVGNIRGECDSWAVFWALNVIAEKGICINPYESLIKNIGLDGSGVHCGVTDRYDVRLAEKERESFILPEKIDISDVTAKAFIPLYGSYTAINQKNEEKQKILVYGLGSFYIQNELTICEKYYVEAFIDKGKKGWFAGKRVIKRDMIDLYTYDLILVMIRDLEECMNVVKELEKLSIDTEKIITGHNFLNLAEKDK